MFAKSQVNWSNVVCCVALKPLESVLEYDTCEIWNLSPISMCTPNLFNFGICSGPQKGSWTGGKERIICSITIGTQPDYVGSVPNNILYQLFCVLSQLYSKFITLAISLTLRFISFQPFKMFLMVCMFTLFTLFRFCSNPLVHLILAI